MLSNVSIHPHISSYQLPWVPESQPLGIIYLGGVSKCSKGANTFLKPLIGVKYRTKKKKYPREREALLYRSR